GAFPPAERPLLEMCDALHRSARLDADLYARLSEGRPSAAIVELLALAGQYHMVSYLANGLGIELEAGAPRFPAQPGPTATGPAWSAMIRARTHAVRSQVTRVTFWPRPFPAMLASLRWLMVSSPSTTATTSQGVCSLGGRPVRRSAAASAAATPGA